MIVWQHWIDAYVFSSSKERYWRIHQKLSRAHVYPKEMDKMKNSTAEEVLDKKMLYLMKVQNDSRLII